MQGEDCTMLGPATVFWPSLQRAELLTPTHAHSHYFPYTEFLSPTQCLSFPQILTLSFSPHTLSLSHPRTLRLSHTVTFPHTHRELPLPLKRVVSVLGTRLQGERANPCLSHFRQLQPIMSFFLQSGPSCFQLGCSLLKVILQFTLGSCNFRIITI